MANLFDHLNAISETKKYSYDEETSHKDYVPYVINTGLSFYPDTIFLVNEANGLNITGQMHYDFLFYLIEPRKRRSKWFKKAESDDSLNVIMDYYDVGPEKATEILKVLKQEDLQKLSEKMRKGGTKNE